MVNLYIVQDFMTLVVVPENLRVKIEFHVQHKKKHLLKSVYILKLADILFSC